MEDRALYCLRGDHRVKLWARNQEETISFGVKCGDCGIFLSEPSIVKHDGKARCSLFSVGWPINYVSNFTYISIVGFQFEPPNFLALSYYKSRQGKDSYHWLKVEMDK